MVYDDEMLQQINDNANLLEYVQNTGIELKQQGEDFFTNCPLHVDDTPSLSFTPAKNSFYCFSCGAKGQMIGYLMKYEGLDFDEAVEKAARIGNTDTSKMCHSETVIFLKKYRKLIEKQKAKKTYEHPVLPEYAITKFSKKEPITEWLTEGISQEMIDLFGARIDTYQNRIVYPVYDIDGNLINVKGRTRYEDYHDLNIPKYINYYKVGELDYLQGLNITLPFVKEKNEIILFESVKSVMKAYSWGYKNCASVENHTLSPEQIRLLIQLRVNVVLAYDSDVNYKDDEVSKGINKLRRLTNVYLVKDYDELLGGAKAKNAPVDCGLDIWEELYENKRKVI